MPKTQVEIQHEAAVKSLAHLSEYLRESKQYAGKRFIFLSQHCMYHVDTDRELECNHKDLRGDMALGRCMVSNCPYLT